MDYTIKIGGEAGQGIQTIGDSLARVFARAGYHVFIHQDYESRIRGGHNFFQIRVSDRPVCSSRDRIDIVIALDRPSIANEQEQAHRRGHESFTIRSTLKEKHDEAPFPRCALCRSGDEGRRERDHGEHRCHRRGAGHARDGPCACSFTVIGELLAKKGTKTVEENQRAAERGRDFAVANCKGCAFKTPAPGRANLLIDGITAIGLGALLSGCRFYSAYPMTPSTGILTFMASKSEEYGVVVEQAEDEIAAINMAIGASFAGVRSMTGTAGGGFALMVEGVSLAAMTETPVVIVVGQRPAPATGLPTRTEQGDLLFVLHAGHGEFPRLLFAPGSPEQALYLTNKAFDLAYKYQIPAFILSDQYLADSQWTYDGFDLGKIVYKDYRLRDPEPQAGKDYKRYSYTDSGISPFAVPGRSTGLVVGDSDEHDEEGHLTEDAAIRNKMVEKRLSRKLVQLRAEIAPPLLYGSGEPETVIVGWGSTYGVLREATDHLAEPREDCLPPLQRNLSLSGHGHVRLSQPVETGQKDDLCGEQRRLPIREAHEGGNGPYFHIDHKQS